jgi:hypothetical protein
VRHEGDDATCTPTRREEGHLVDVFDEDIVRPIGEQSAICATGERWPREARADANDIDSVKRCPGRAIGPPTAQQRHFVPTSGKTSEDLVQMKLGPTCLRILPVLPIDD